MKVGKRKDGIIMVVRGKEVIKLGVNPKVWDLVIGQRYLVNDLRRVLNKEFYLDETVFEYESGSEGVSSGVLRYIGDGTKTPEGIDYGRDFFLLNTFDGDDYDE